MNLDPIKKLSLKKKIMIANAVLLTMAAAIIYLVIWPSIADIKRMRDDIHGQMVDLEDKYQKGQSMKKMNENLKIIEPKLEKLDQIFISKNREVEFVTAMEDLAGRIGVEQRLNLGAAQQARDKAYQKMPITIGLSGSFTQLINYLAELESLSYYINISAIDLASGGSRRNAVTNDGGGNLVSMNISAFTYWK